eukprot:Skav215427  [mRNA]  locus=scaffold745:171099:172123:- [translate_table: standard]
MSLPLAAAVERATAQRLPSLAAAVHRCSTALDVGLFERIIGPNEAAAAPELAAEVEPIEMTGPAEMSGSDPVASVAEGVEGTSVAMGLTPGTNVMTGMAVGVLSGMMSPELRALQQRSGLVTAVSQVAIMGLGALIARSAPCQGITQALSGVLQYVPFLRGENFVAQSVQLLVGSQLGQMIGHRLRQQNLPAGKNLPAAAAGAGGIARAYLSDVCTVCNSDLQTGTEVIMLSCGHACLCKDVGGSV